MVYDCRRAVISCISAGEAPQAPSQWTVIEVSGTGGEYGGTMGPAVCDPVV